MSMRPCCHDHRHIPVSASFPRSRLVHSVRHRHRRRSFRGGGMPGGPWHVTRRRLGGRVGQAPATATTNIIVLVFPAGLTPPHTNTTPPPPVMPFTYPAVPLPPSTTSSASPGNPAPTTTTPTDDSDTSPKLRKRNNYRPMVERACETCVKRKARVSCMLGGGVLSRKALV